MITLFIIIVLGFIIYKAIVNPSDKKDKKEIVEDKEKIAQLPDICFKGKELYNVLQICSLGKRIYWIFSNTIVQTTASI